MARTNRMNNVAAYKADIEDAIDLVSVDALPKLRSGKPREDLIYCGDDASEYYDKANEIARANRRTNAHNGVSVPSKYETKPKSKEIKRVSLRKSLVNEEALDAEYTRYSYEAAGMC